MLDQTSFEALGLSDAALARIEWLESGRDLEIALVRASGEPLTLVCSWAQAREIHLRTGAREGGYPLTWSAALVPAGKHWRLSLDFASQGRVELLCNGVFIGPQD